MMGYFNIGYCWNMLKYTIILQSPSLFGGLSILSWNRQPLFLESEVPGIPSKTHSRWKKARCNRLVARGARAGWIGKGREWNPNEPSVVGKSYCANMCQLNGIDLIWNDGSILVHLYGVFYVSHTWWLIICDHSYLVIWSFYRMGTTKMLTSQAWQRIRWFLIMKIIDG